MITYLLVQTVRAICEYVLENGPTAHYHEQEIISDFTLHFFVPLQRQYLRPMLPYQMFRFLPSLAYCRGNAI